MVKDKYISENCDFCNQYFLGLNIKKLVTNDLNICIHCIRNITINEVTVRLRHKSKTNLFLTIKEITNDNKF